MSDIRVGHLYNFMRTHLDGNYVLEVHSDGSGAIIRKVSTFATEDLPDSVKYFPLIRFSSPLDGLDKLRKLLYNEDSNG